MCILSNWVTVSLLYISYRPMFVDWMGL